MARLSRPISRRQTWWLLACAVATALPLAAQVPYWVTAYAAAAFAWRGLISWRHFRLPPRWLLLPLVAIGTLGVAMYYRALFGRMPGVALLVIFLSLKLLELRSARDAHATVFLCFFLVLAQFLFNQSIPAAVVAGLTLLMATAALAAASDDRPAPSRQLAHAAVMLAQALPFMLLLFVLFPRIQGPLWGLPQDTSSATSGLSDRMSPGSIAQLSQSDAIAFRVRFKDKPPAQTQLYWRGPVMPNFDGRTWQVARRAGTLDRLPYAVAGPALTYEMTLEPHGKAWLFPLEMPGALPADSAFTSDLQIMARQPLRARQRYEMQSHPGDGIRLAEQPALLREALALPPGGNPRIRAVAADWRRQHGDDNAAILAAAEDFFGRQILVYTLSPPILGADTVDEFLFDSKRGFCEHFASAFVFALRAAGVPARIVAGYQGGEINPVDGYLEVRQYDAHAWAEVWQGAAGWMRVDPTAISAPRRINANVAAAVPSGEPLPFLARGDLAWLRDLRHRIDAIANGWNQWVLGYNPQRQKDFLQSLGLASPDWQNMTAILAVLSGLFLLALTAWVLKNRQPVDPALAQWRRFAARTARRGVSWRPWEGPRDFAARAALALPEHAAAITEITALYVALRYAGNAAPQDLARLKHLIQTFKP